MEIEKNTFVEAPEGKGMKPGEIIETDNRVKSLIDLPVMI